MMSKIGQIIASVNDFEKSEWVKRHCFKPTECLHECQAVTAGKTLNEDNESWGFKHLKQRRSVQCSSGKHSLCHWPHDGIQKIDKQAMDSLLTFSESEDMSQKQLLEMAWNDGRHHTANQPQPMMNVQMPWQSNLSSMFEKVIRRFEAMFLVFETFLEKTVKGWS